MNRKRAYHRDSVQFLGRSLRIGFVTLSGVYSATFPVQAEDWLGYQDGLQRHAGTVTEIAPDALQVSWHRVFDDPVVAPTCTWGSRNLVCVGGKLAIIQPAEKGFPRDFDRTASSFQGYQGRGYITLLDASSGTTLQCIRVKLGDGNRHNSWYPTGLLVDAADTLGGMSVLGWDGPNGNLYIRTGGDGCYASGYKPLANLVSYHGGWQDGVVAFPEGRTMPKWKKDPVPLAPDEWTPIRPNDTSFFAVDSTSPLMVVTAGSNHYQAGGLAFADKNSGQQIAEHFTDRLKPVNDPPLPKGEATKTPEAFAKWASVIIAPGRIYYLGAGDDNDGDGTLGNAVLCADSMKPEPEMEKDRLGQASGRWHADNPDQGLSICSYDFQYTAGAVPSLTLSPAFIHRFVSPHKPEHGPADCESYLETDHFYRNKTFLIDDKSVWAVWQKSKADGAELIHCDDKTAKTWPLGVAVGRRGQDVWGHLSMADVSGHKYLAYYAGNAFWQEYLDDKPPYRPANCFSPEMKPPLGPAELSVFDATGEKVQYTYNLSAHFPSLPPNLAQHYLDESQMVVAGKWAYVGWVDLTEEKAMLHLVGFDVTAFEPHPVDKVFPLDFDSKSFPNSILTDLIAVDGRLHALVTQASKLAPNLPRFEAQHILTLASPIKK